MTTSPLNGLQPDASFRQYIGTLIGTGTSRKVHDVPGHPDVVIKEALMPGAYSNRAEHFIWCQIGDEEGLTAILGRCYSISISGRYLIMEKLNDLSTPEHKEACRIPCWVTDRKISNFGVNAAGLVKMRDYANLKLGQFLSRMPIERVFPAPGVQGK